MGVIAIKKVENVKKEITGVSYTILGCLAGAQAAVFINPLDLIKTRLQLQSYRDPIYNGSGDCLRKILKNENFFGLFAGLQAGILRQLFYCGGRFGTYQYLENLYFSKYGEKCCGKSRIVNGTIAGGVGSFLAGPTEIVLVRMMVDKMLPPDQRRNYKNPIDAMIRISKEEGSLTLFKGIAPTMYKGIIINMIQLGPYFEFKEYMIRTHGFHDGRILVFISSFVMGFFSSVASSPLDFAKSRLQQMHSEKGKPKYTSTLYFLFKIARTEGPLRIYSGFFPYFFRLATCNVLTFVFLEELTNIYLNFT